MIDTMIKDFSLGISSYVKAISYGFNKVYLQYYLISFVLVLIFLSPIYLVDNLLSWLSSQIDFLSMEQSVLFITKYLAKLSGFILLLVLTPIFTIIAEKTDELLTGNLIPFSFSAFVSDMFRAIKLIAVNIVKLGVLMLIFHLAGILIGGIDLLVNIVTFLLVSYYYGFSLIDYSLERKQFNYRSTLIFIKKHRTLCIAIGIIFHSTLMIFKTNQIENLLGSYHMYCSIFAEILISILGVIAGAICIDSILKNNNLQTIRT